MIVLVTGGRDFLDRALAFRTLDRVDFDHCIEGIIEGGQRTLNDNRRIIGGADFFAQEWARARGVPHHAMPAEWARWGRAHAGRIRNAEMLRIWRPGLVVAFPGNEGTADMVERARREPVEVIEVA